MLHTKNYATSRFWPPERSYFIICEWNMVQATGSPSAPLVYYLAPYFGPPCSERRKTLLLLMLRLTSSTLVLLSLLFLLQRHSVGFAHRLRQQHLSRARCPPPLPRLPVRSVGRQRAARALHHLPWDGSFEICVFPGPNTRETKPSMSYL